MDFVSMMQKALQAGFTLDNKGELKGSTANWFTMAAQQTQEDQMKRMHDHAHDHNNSWNNDWNNKF